MSMIKGLRAATARSPTRKAVTVQTMAAAGLTVSGVSAPGEESRLLSAVDRCIEILSDSVAKLPSYVIQRSTRERVPHQILYLLNDRPNEAMTPFVRKKVLETSRLEGGNTLAISGLTATGATATTGVLPESGTVAYVVTVTDSRGLATVLRGTITVLPYAAPGIRSISVARCDADGADNPAGAYALVSFAGSVSALDDQNTAAYAIRYRPQGADTWSNQAVPAASGQYAPSASGIIPAAVDTVFEVCVSATDALSRTDSLIVILPSAQVLFRTAPNADGLSIGQYRTESGALIVGGLIEALKLPAMSGVSLGGTVLLDLLHPVGSIYQSTDATSPADLFGGTWEQVKDVFLLAAGDSHAAGSTGGEETHTLTKAEIPDHAHTLKYTGQSVTEGVNAIRLYQAASNQYNAYSGGQSSDCGDQAHNNMPPYLAVYTWRRTA